MNKKYDADKFLSIQYPIIKAEVSQANSSLGMILSFIWGILAIIVSVILSVWLTVNYTKWFIIFWSIVSVLSVVICSILLIKSFKIFRQLRPNLKSVKSQTLANIDSHMADVALMERIKKFNPTYFATFEYISMIEFIDLFEHNEDELTKLMLGQAYINGRLAHKKYAVARNKLF